jgi:hypothetical protein
MYDGRCSRDSGEMVTELRKEGYETFQQTCDEYWVDNLGHKRSVQIEVPRCKI